MVGWHGCERFEKVSHCCVQPCSCPMSCGDVQVHLLHLNLCYSPGATSIGSAVSPSDHSSDLESYKLDIVSCDLSVVASKKNPQDAIKSLFFNAYSLLVHILGTCFNTIKAVALDAVRMKQVAASRERVMEVSDVSSLFECLEIDKKWDDLHFLDVAISRLPPATKAAARLVLGHYKSHLSAYTKAVSIKEAKNVFGIFCRKRDREGKSVVTEITVDKEIDEYTCYDCLNLWKKFLVAKLEIPEGSIQFHDARPGNSTILLFTVPNSCVERLEKKLSQPDVMWTMKELDILRVIVVGMLNVDMYNVIPAVHIREGLQSGVNFIALTKVCVCVCVCACVCVRVCVCVCACVCVCVEVVENSNQQICTIR